jgi:membrane fusion protein, multidrug efflux system
MTAVLAVALVSCSSKGAKDKKGDVGDMKVKLEKLKKDKTALDAEISKLEDQIAKADPNAAQQAKKLVSIDTVNLSDFQHYIELQGKIDAEGMAFVAPSIGGAVRLINVKLGQRVSKGQLILRLDDAGSGQAVEAAQQQVNLLKSRLAQAQTIHQRYESLWKQNIGAEIQVINAKADVDVLQAQVRAAEATVTQARAIANMANVYAPISGTVDLLNVKVGEYYSPQSLQKLETSIRIVNNSSMKMVTEVPENYIGRVRVGDKVIVEVPETGKSGFNSVISVVSSAISPTSRGFVTEARLPSDPLLKPNQTASMKILDFESKNAVTVPINVVQSDEKGKYVYVIEKTGDKLIARKKTVIVGEAYGGKMEIKSGIKSGDVIITEGYQTVYDGQAVLAG